MNRWPLHKAYFWESAPFFRLLVPLVAGILCYAIPGAPAPAVECLLIFSFIIFVIGHWKQKQALSFIASQSALLSIGWLLCYTGDARNDTDWFGHKINTADFFEGRITAAPLEKESSYKLAVSLISVMEPGKLTITSGEGFAYLLKDGKPINVSKGDTILVPNRWRPVQNAGNPFEFDYAAYCRRNNIYYQLAAPSKEIVVYKQGNPGSAPLTERCHDWCMSQLARYIHDKRTLGLIQAMLIGDEVNLDNETRQSFADTGIVHIIAISGGNVLIFFMAINLLLWWLKHKKYKWVKYAIALPLVWFYVLMAGAPPSAIRAAIMFSLLAFGIMLQKDNNSLNTLFATAFILLCAEPVWLYSIGFQLSFIAVLSLILFYGPIYKLYGAGNIVIKLLWQTIAASLAAEILTAPLVVYYFHMFPLMFLVANVAAYLFMSIVLYLGMAILIFSWLPIFAKCLGALCEWLVSAFNVIVHWLQAFNPEALYYLQIDGAELTTIYVLIACISAWLLRKQKAGLLTGLAAACLLLCLLCEDEYIALHQDRFVAYNTGKSLHAELITGKKYAVLHTDSLQAQKISYDTKPAHTGWHAWRLDAAASTPPIVAIAGRTILLYTDSIAPQQQFKVDYLVVCHPNKLDAVQLYNRFHPTAIVLPQVPANMLQNWKVAVGKLPVKLHYLPDDGAFVLE